MSPPRSEMGAENEYIGPYPLDQGRLSTSRPQLQEEYGPTATLK